MNLDITFSDHHMSEATLKAFGDVVRSLRKVCDEDDLRFWTFIYYVAKHHPDILSLTLVPDQEDRCATILAKANIPPVTVAEVKRVKMRRKLEKRGGSDGNQPGNGVGSP
jgi:hypothetical protein